MFVQNKNIKVIKNRKVVFMEKKERKNKKRRDKLDEVYLKQIHQVYIA